MDALADHLFVEGVEVRDGQPDLAMPGWSRGVRVGMVGSVRQVQSEGYRSRIARKGECKCNVVPNLCWLRLWVNGELVLSVRLEADRSWPPR